MTAKKKTVIVLIIGIIIGIKLEVFAPICMLFVFGYAFGWNRYKGIIVRIGIISIELLFVAILVKLSSGAILQVTLFLVKYGFIVGMSTVWGLGVVWGMKELYVEYKEHAIESKQYQKRR